MPTPDPDLWRPVRSVTGHHSLWRADLALPPGWTEAGPATDQPACLAAIPTLWTDPRPVALRAATANPDA